MSLKLVIIGSSHIRRLLDAAVPIPLHSMEIAWRCEGGARLPMLRGVVDDIEWQILERPDVVVVFLGGNDLDSRDVDARRLASLYATEYNSLAAMGCEVVILRGWPRPGARIGPITYWTNVESFEDEMADLLRDGCHLWTWDRSLTFTSQFFAFDGVHCRPTRYKKVMRYLVSAVLFAVRRLNREPFSGR